jgi:hypothetical protein
MLTLTTFSFNAGYCTSEERLPDSLEDIGCRTIHLKSILYPLQILDVIIVCSINRCPQRYKSKWHKSGTEKTDPHSVPEISCSRMRQLQKENVVGHRHAWIPACRSTSCNSSGKKFRRKSGKQPQSGVAEERRVPQVCLLQCLHGNSTQTLWRVFLMVRRAELGNHASECQCTLYKHRIIQTQEEECKQTKSTDIVLIHNTTHNNNDLDNWRKP